MKSICFLFVFLTLSLGLTLAVEKPCGDWEPFKDEKCFKVFDTLGFQNYTDAETTCAAHDGGKLISISFKAEQDFIANYLFKQKQIVDSLWLGAKVTSSVFHWEDGTNLTFTNWASGEPKNQADHCAQMNGDGETAGKWVEASCKKKNLVVCQKRQLLSLAHIQERLLQVEKNPVPLGFIYVQFPKEKAPVDIWPWMIWTDVTSAYAGVFFRAEGGGANSFGSIQEENAPTIDKVEAEYCQWDSDGKCHFGSTAYTFSPSVSLPKTTGWSDYVGSSDYWYSHTSTPFYQVLNRYHTTSGEIRPRNMAIKVWKRSA